MASVPSALVWPVAASASMKAYVPRGRGGVQPAHQIVDRAGWPIAVVLDLGNADDVGARAQQTGDGLGRLAVELSRRIRATAIGRRAARAIGAVVYVVRQAVEGVEIVEQIGRSHAQPARELTGAGARIGPLEGRQAAAQRAHRPDAIGVGAGRIAGPIVDQHAHDAGRRCRRRAACSPR